MDRDAQGKLSPVVCDICERACRLGPCHKGACGLYQQQDGEVVEVLADHYLVVSPISIETMPLLHYYPGHKFLQISTTGCNFDCPGCISTVLVREMPRDSQALTHWPPEHLAAHAVSTGCMGIAFLMNDPLASLPSFLRAAAEAKRRGLKVGCSSNAYFTDRSLESILPYLDFINVGLKGFSDLAYRRCGAKAGMAPVFRNLERLHQAGVHVEVSVIYSQGMETELHELASRLADISPSLPLQLMRFIPFEQAGQEQEPSIRQAEELCSSLRTILRHVYLFNTPGAPELNTICPSCGHTSVRRMFFGPMGAKLLGEPPAISAEPLCAACGGSLDITGQRAVQGHQEEAFMGGYPFTRALEMVEAMLIAVGVRRKAEIVKAWEHLLEEGGLHRLHHDVQHPPGYISTLRQFAAVVGASQEAEELARYLEDKLAGLARDLDGLGQRPRVYYAMAKPLFYINGKRLENNLVELAGGESLNKQLPFGGRPGRMISVEQLNELNPEIIFISAFLSNSPEDFLTECRSLGVDAEAVHGGRVYAHPAPGWDFGSPRWILGLLHMAQVFHPRRCDYDVMAEASELHRRFYGVEFNPLDVNRSFAKPSDNWRWQGRGERAALAPAK